MSDRERWGHEGFEELMRQEHNSFYRPKQFYYNGRQSYGSRYPTSYYPKHFKPASCTQDWHKHRPYAKKDYHPYSHKPDPKPYHRKWAAAPEGKPWEYSHAYQAQSSNVGAKQHSYSSLGEYQQDRFGEKQLSEQTPNNFKSELGTETTEGEELQLTSAPQKRTERVFQKKEFKQEIKLSKPRFIFKKKEEPSRKEDHESLKEDKEDDILMSMPTQASASDIASHKSFFSPPSPATEPTITPPLQEAAQSHEFNPVLLQVKIQTERGPIDVAIRQLDQPLNVAHQLCQQYGLDMKLVPAIAHQFNLALQQVRPVPQMTTTPPPPPPLAFPDEC